MMRPTISRIGGTMTMKNILAGERIVCNQRICENKEKGTDVNKEVNLTDLLKRLLHNFLMPFLQRF